MRFGVLFLFIVTLLVLLSSFALAQPGEVYHLKLLAVQEVGDSYIGSEADVFLELREGSGRVFLDTFPLTKLDTQISTRFAKEVACSHFKLDCDQYDFIYTIKSQSTIIGGPSAGAALAGLTTIAVLDLEYDEDIAVTGSINSGGIVGPVGGVREKIEGAKKAKIQKVLIPTGSSASHFGDEANMTNQTLDLVEYAKDNLSITVVEVATIDDVVFEITGESLNGINVDIQENDEYTKIMRALYEGLCSRGLDLSREIRDAGIVLNQSQHDSVQKKLEEAQNASLVGDYYSAASYCFGANIETRDYYYQKRNMTNKSLTRSFDVLKRKTNAFIEKVDEESIDTISDLQTLMVVKERLGDVLDQVTKFEEGDHSIQGASSLLAYADERLYSAVSWMQFFSMDGKKIVVNEAKLRETCYQKILEADERYQYSNLFLSRDHTMGIKEKIDVSRTSLDTKEYALCLITASQAKADANAILSTLGVTDDTVQELLENKKRAAKRIIAQNSEEGIFPILGYSYFQYGNSLQVEEKYTALLYLEYALEMSELGIYFPQERNPLEYVRFRGDTVVFVQGILVGALVMLLLTYFLWRKNPRKKKE